METEQVMFVATLIGLFTTIIAMVGGGIWTVATMKSEGKSNRETSTVLSSEISKLSAIVSKIDDKVEGHNDRLIRLEVVQQNNGNVV
jgi:hypothetical protein